MNVSDIYTSVRDRLVEKVANATIVETAVEGDEISNTSAGLFDPYCVVTFGGPIEASHGRHITNRRMNLLHSWVIVTTVAPKHEDGLKIVDQVIDALWGFMPVDSGEMIMTGGTAQSRTSEQAKPAKYMFTTMFQIPHNVSGMIE